MKSNLKLHAAIIGILFLLLSISVNAQSRKTVKVNIPFDFMVAGDIFEAGDYTVERFIPQRRSALILKAVEGNGKKVFLTNRVKVKEIVETPKLVFTKINDSYFLSQIWFNSTKNGLELISSKEERKMEKLAEAEKVKYTVFGSN